MKGLNGKTAIVTGGASGIGRAIVARLAEEGCQVAVFDINASAAAEVASEIGPAVRTYAVDITDLAAVESAVAKVEEELGDIWLLVNNAGWDQPEPFLGTGPDLWKRIIDLNLYGPLHMHHAVCTRMKQRNAGRVVNVSSDAARVGTSNEAVYSACKGGIISFGKSMCRELARNNILLNTVCPGPTDTPFMDAVVGKGEQAQKWKDSMVRGIPLRRMGQPEDYPGIVAFLASDDAAYITGQTISVSGGLTMIG